MFHYTMAWITIFLASYSKFFTTLFHNFSWFFQHLAFRRAAGRCSAAARRTRLPGSRRPRQGLLPSACLVAATRGGQEASRWGSGLHSWWVVTRSIFRVFIGHLHIFPGGKPTRTATQLLTGSVCLLLLLIYACCARDSHPIVHIFSYPVDSFHLPDSIL